MFLPLIPQHLSALQSSVAPNTLLVYKGFPNDFLLKMMEEVPSVLPQEQLFDEQQMMRVGDYPSQVDEFPAKINAQEGMGLLLMEHLVALSKEDLLSQIERPIRVIVNNLSKEYLNPSTLQKIPGHRSRC